MATQEPMTWTEFRDSGLLSEINRRVLHPIGLAMSMILDDNGEATLGPILVDDDPEGWLFSPTIMGQVAANATSVAVREREWHPRRRAVLGFVIQPVGGEE